jgi:hypothetical protein
MDRSYTPASPLCKLRHVMVLPLPLQMTQLIMAQVHKTHTGLDLRYGRTVSLRVEIDDSASSVMEHSLNMR